MNKNICRSVLLIVIALLLIAVSIEGSRFAVLPVRSIQKNVNQQTNPVCCCDDHPTLNCTNAMVGQSAYVSSYSATCRWTSEASCMNSKDDLCYNIPKNDCGIVVPKRINDLQIYLKLIKERIKRQFEK